MSLTNDKIITHGPLCHCLSFFTVKLDPFTSLCHYKLSLKKKKKKSKTIHTSRQCASLPLSDVIVGNACHGVSKKMMGIRQFSSCPEIAGGLVMVVLQPSRGFGGCRCNFVAAFNLKTTTQKSEGWPELPLSPSKSNPSNLCPWLPRALQHEAGK